MAAEYVSVPGARLYVQRWGSGMPLVCLHGLGGGGHLFAALGDALDGVAVIAPDAPAAGHTQGTEFSFESCAETIVELARSELREMEFPGKVAVLGHSMGTIVALEIARRAPDLVAGLIFVGGLPEPLPAARERFRARIDRVEREGMIGLADEVVTANFAAKTRTGRPELTALFGRLFEFQPAEGYLATIRALTDWTAPPLPPLDDIPCLAVTGDEDLYAPPEAVRAFAAALPRARLEILPDCGHLPFLEQPRALAGLISTFLAEAFAHG